MSKRNARPQTAKPEISAPSPEIETALDDLLTGDPEMQTPLPEMETRLPEDTGGGRAVVEWLGPVEPHACPECGWRLLLDRRTKACVVQSTRAQVRDQTGAYRDREMKCLHCDASFVARENIS